MIDQELKKLLQQYEDPSEVEELILDNKKIMNLANITTATSNSNNSSSSKDFTPLNELINLRSLSMNNTLLHSIEGFPTLSKLRRVQYLYNK